MLLFTLAYCVPGGSVLPLSNPLLSIHAVVQRCIAGLFVSHPQHNHQRHTHLLGFTWLRFLLLNWFFYSVWKVGMLVWEIESRNQRSNIIFLITDLSKPNQRKYGLSQSDRVYPLQHNPQFLFPCCLGLIKAPFWCRRVPKVHAWIIPPTHTHTHPDS